MPHLQPSSNCWRTLEFIRGLSAVPAIWRRYLSEDYEAFKRAFLLPRPEPARHFPCSECGCSHQIVTEQLPSPSSTILVAPTHDHLDATCQELLANAGAGFFALAGLAAFDGSLRLMGKVPGELFARFSAQPQAVEQDLAQRAFALIQTLDSEAPLKPP